MGPANDAGGLDDEDHVQAIVAQHDLAALLGAAIADKGCGIGQGHRAVGGVDGEALARTVRERCDSR